MVPVDRLFWRPVLLFTMRQSMDASPYNIDHFLLSYLRLAWQLRLRVSVVREAGLRR